MVVKKYRDFVQTGIVNNVSTTSTIVPFDINFSSIPRVFAQSYATSTGTITISSTSTASFSILGASAGTATWMAMLVTE